MKYNPNGSVERFKARIVAKGSNKKGLDYYETYSPVAKHPSIRTILSIANYFQMELHQMNVMTAFLNDEA